jgi:MFS family permease
MIRLLRASTLFAATGLGVCLAIASPLAAVVGFAVLSVGTACVNPSVYTLAGDQRGLSASEAVSVVEIAQMPGGTIAAPAVIGALSSLVGLRIALGSIVVASLLLAVLAGLVERTARPGSWAARARPCDAARRNSARTDDSDRPRASPF